MIIWSRWGIVVFLFVGLGIALGFGLKALAGGTATNGAGVGVFVGLGFLLAGALLWFFNRLVVGKYIDKPRPAVMYEQLAQPIVHPNGVTERHRVIPILHPDTGQQIYTNPVSTFFFIPIKYWSFLLGILGLVIFIINLVVLITGGQ